MLADEADAKEARLQALGDDLERLQAEIEAERVQSDTAHAASMDRLKAAHAEALADARADYEGQVIVTCGACWW